MTMTEKVGDALANECQTIFGSTWSNDVRWRLARAAIEAMRPTEQELKAAGCDDDQSGAPYCVNCHFLAEQFAKFIDAAVKAR